MIPGTVQDEGMRARLEAALEGVEGWLHLGEAWALHETVRRALPPARPATVVEIGSFKGRSTIALGLAVQRAPGGGTVYAIDPHTIDEGNVEVWHSDRMPDLVENVERAGVAEFVEPVRAYSHEARARFADGSVDALFVDGSHEYEDVIQDIDDWTSALTNPAPVAFNDPNWPGVNRALRERAGRRGSAFRRPRYVYNSVFLDYAPGRPWGPADTVAVLRLRAFLRVLMGIARVHEAARRRGLRRVVIGVEMFSWLAVKLLPRVR